MDNVLLNLEEKVVVVFHSSFLSIVTRKYFSERRGRRSHASSGERLRN